MFEGPRCAAERGQGMVSTGSSLQLTRITALAWAARALLLAVSCLRLLAVSPTANSQNVATTIPPNDPTKQIKAIAVNPTENYVYVTQGDGTLTIINAGTNLGVASSAPGTTGSAAMATYLNNVFVANGGSNNVSVYFPVSPAGPNGSAFQQTFGDANAIQPTAIAKSGSIWSGNWLRPPLCPGNIGEVRVI